MVCYYGPEAYENCMQWCGSGENPGLHFECHHHCYKYKTKPWCIEPMPYAPLIPYGMTQPVPYSPHPYYDPYSNFPMQPRSLCPPEHEKVRVCDSAGRNCRLVCLPT